MIAGHQQVAGRKRSRGVHRFAVLVACLTFVLVIAGALVTSNDAGLSVPDWPTSFGTFRIPRMVGGVKFEDGHRMIAGVVATLTVVLALLIVAKDDRRWMKWLGGAAVLAVIVQAVLGGLGVLHYLETGLTVSHSLMAQIYFCIMVSLALFSSPKWRWDSVKKEDTGRPGLRRVAIALSIIVLIQIMLGAIFRNEVQDQLGKTHYTHTIGVLPHIIGAGVVLAVAVWLLVSMLKVPGRNAALAVTTIGVVMLVVIQIFLGIGVYMMMLFAQRAPEPVTPVVISTVAHVAIGALIFTGSVVVTCLAFRFVASPAASPGVAADLPLTGEALR